MAAQVASMIRKIMMNFRAIIAVALLVLSINFIRCALIYMSLNLIIHIGNAFASFLSASGKGYENIRPRHRKQSCGDYEPD